MPSFTNLVARHLSITTSFTHCMQPAVSYNSVASHLYITTSFTYCMQPAVPYNSVVRHLYVSPLNHKTIHMTACHQLCHQAMPNCCKTACLLSQELHLYPISVQLPEFTRLYCIPPAMPSSYAPNCCKTACFVTRITSLSYFSTITSPLNFVL